MLVERPAHPLSRNPYASEDIKALQTNRLLRTLRTDEMTQLIAVGRWVVFQPGQTVTYCGTPVAEVLFLLKGRAKAEASAPNGGTFSAVLNLLRPGDDVGLLSLVDDAPHSATVTSLDTLHVLSIPMTTMRELLNAHVEWYRTLAEVAVWRLRNSAVWLQSLM